MLHASAAASQVQVVFSELGHDLASWTTSTRNCLDKPSQLRMGWDKDQLVALGVCYLDV